MGHGGWPLVKLSREGSCLGDARRMLLFRAEQVFLPTGKFWSMPNADAQCTVEGREEAKGQRKFFTFKFSCLAIKCEFDFTQP